MVILFYLRRLTEGGDYTRAAFNGVPGMASFIALMSETNSKILLKEKISVVQ